jgi:glycosyltransferase involved in cell wall biosynthesis
VSELKRLLAISWEMPPLSGPRAVQVTRLLRYLVPLGWASTVICFGPRSNRYNQDYVIDPASGTDEAIELVRVPSPEESLLVRALWRVCPPVKLLPDEKSVWIGRAVAAARLRLAAGSFDALVSFAQPWSDHLIGLRLHRESGLPWIAHFSDPWVESPYVRGFAWQQWIWRRMERDVVANATRLVFQNSQTAGCTMEKYPAEWKRKVAVIPQGFDPDHALPAFVQQMRRAGPLRIVYTGRFYPGIRTPESVLQALSLLNPKRKLSGQITLDFYGFPFQPYVRRAEELGIADIVRFHGRVPPPAAVAAAREADMLLVIDAPSRGPSLFLPSKLVNYLPLRKPILGVVPAAGPSADLLRALDYPVVDPLDVEGIARMLSEAIDRWQRGALTVSTTHDATAWTYNIQETSRAFSALLDDTVPPA